MFEYLIDIILLRRLGLGPFFRLIVLLLLIGIVVAGLIYAAAVFHAISERSEQPHVHAHSTH